MAHTNSERVSQKIYNAASSFRSSIRRISHLPQGSIVTTAKKSLSQNTDYPVRTHSPQITLDRDLHHSKMIPIEFDPQGAQGKRIPMSFHPGNHSAAEENINGKQVQDSADTEIQIVKSHKFVPKSASRKQEKAIPLPDTPTEHRQPNQAWFGNAKSEEEEEEDDVDPRHEQKMFTDYIDKVKNRLIRTASHVGSADGRLARKESSSDKVSHYANPTKVNARTTVNVGEGY